MQKYLLLLVALSLFACQNPVQKERATEVKVESTKGIEVKPIPNSPEAKALKAKPKEEETPAVNRTARRRRNTTTYTYSKTLAAIDTLYPVEDSSLEFKVDEVEMAKDYLSAFSAKEVMENKLEKRLEFIPKVDENLALVPSRNNVFLNTVQTAYDQHRPLVLSPDIIWLAICQGVGLHINENFERLQSKLYTHKKQKTIVQRNDSLEYAANHWGELVDSLALKTEKYTKANFYDFFVADFSTTTEREERAYQITLLYTHKKAFKYVGASGCGIPYIRLEGTTADWQEIYDKLDFLDELELEAWKKSLKPVIQEFIQGSKGEANPEFWQSIYKDASVYSAFYISGWVIKFFPYIKKLDYNQSNAARETAEILVPNPFLAEYDYLKSTLSTDNFPEGIVEVTIEWRNYFKGTRTEMLAFAGFFGIKQYEDKALKAHISWGISKKYSPSIKYKFLYKKRQAVSRSSKLNWLPRFYNYVQKPAIYNPSNFKTQRESFQMLQEILLDSIENNKNFDLNTIKKLSLEAEILANGKISEVRLLYCKNKALENYLKQILKASKKEWSPAFGLIREPRFGMYPEGEFSPYLIRVNSKVWIKLKI